LTPYVAPSPTTTPKIFSSPPIPTHTPLPTATPFTYLIEEGDTLLAIAFRFGVTVDEIMAANPAVNPQFLTIGETLVIPIGDGEIAVIPTPTPVVVKASDPVCYPAADQGMWCFVSISNTQPVLLEGVIGRVILYNRAGEVLEIQEAYPPLNLIRPGERLPLTAYFNAPIPEGFVVRGEVSSAFTYNPDEARYLDAQIEVTDMRITDDRQIGIVTGELFYLEAGPEVKNSVFMVAVTAYGSQGEVAGMRKWEMEATLALGERLPFKIQVFSLQPAIEELDVHAEIRPLATTDEQENP
jgi:LysM repeat protein